MTSDPSNDDSSPEARHQRMERTGKQPDLLLDSLQEKVDENLAEVIDPESTWTAREEVGKKTIVTTLLTVFLLVTGFLLTLKIIDRNRPSPPPRITSPAPPKPPPVPNLMERGTTQEIRASTEAAIRGFMEAASHTERCQFVIGGTELEEIMREFYRRPDSPPPDGFGELLDVQPAAFSGTPMQVAMASEANRRIGWKFSLFPMPHRMLIDWESSVGYGEVSWPDFLYNRPREDVQMRVYLKRAHTFLPPYAEGSHVAFEITARAQEIKVFGYAPRNSDLHRDLWNVVPAGASQPVNVRLKWETDNPAHHVVRITTLLHNFWVDTDRLREVYQAETKAAKEPSQLGPDS